MGLVRSHLAPCSSNAVPAIQVCGAADAPQVPAMLTTPMCRHACSESPVHPVQVAILQRLQRVVSVRSVHGRARCTRVQSSLVCPAGSSWRHLCSAVTMRPRKSCGVLETHRHRLVQCCWSTCCAASCPMCTCLPKVAADWPPAPALASSDLSVYVCVCVCVCVCVYVCVCVCVYVCVWRRVLGTSPPLLPMPTQQRAFFSRSAEADRQRTQDREAGRDNKAAANAGFTAQGGSE